MLISDQKKFVFVHVFKTGGTSIKRVLRRYAMPGWQEFANFFLKRVGIPQFGPPDIPDHWRASDLIESIGELKFRKYFSFGFVRNPWDLEVSHYKYILKVPVHPSHELVSTFADFDEYIRWRCDGNCQMQSDLLVYENEIAVDFVGRFETLEEDFQVVCRQLGIPFRLPKLNQSGRRDYRTCYTDATAGLVAEAFAEDIARFGYRFEPSRAAA